MMLSFQVENIAKVTDKKYQHNVKLSQLQDPDLYVWTNTDYEIESYLKDLPLDSMYKKEITGIVALLCDGEIYGLWLTESNMPYNLNSYYHPLPYYLTSKKVKKNIDKLPIIWHESNREYFF